MIHQEKFQLVGEAQKLFGLKLLSSIRCNPEPARLNFNFTSFSSKETDHGD